MASKLVINFRFICTIARYDMFVGYTASLVEPIYPYHDEGHLGDCTMMKRNWLQFYLFGLLQLLRQ